MTEQSPQYIAPAKHMTLATPKKKCGSMEYATAEESARFIKCDTRTNEEKILYQLMEERGAFEQGAEYGHIMNQLVLELLEEKFQRKPLTDTMNWKPIETAPKDGTEIFVGVEIGEVWIARNARFVCADQWVPGEQGDTDGWWSYRNSVSQVQLDGLYEPTHWCQMPVPPNV